MFFDPVSVILNKMLSDPRINSNEIATNTVKLLQQRDSRGLQEMAENLCKQKNVTPEEVREKLLKKFGLG